MDITVYTLPNCVQCDQTKRFFDQKDVKYTTVDLSTDAQAYAMVSELGYKSAPVVKVGEEMWSGFRLEKLNKTAVSYTLEQKA